MNENAQNIIIKKENNSKNDDVVMLVERKLNFFKDVIQKTILYVQKNKTFDILGVSDVISCIERLTEINKLMLERKLQDTLVYVYEGNT